jgi:hypothetical protein
MEKRGSKKTVTFHPGYDMEEDHTLTSGYDTESEAMKRVEK